MAKTRFNFLIEQEKIKKLKIIAINKNTTVTEIILNLLNDYMEKEGKKNEA